MSETNLRLSFGCRNLEGNLSVLPLVLVLDESEMVVQNEPGDSFVGS
jgi:hypothetical protein